MDYLLKKHCTVLGVKTDAARKDIKAAHRRIVMKFHPDRQCSGRRHSLDDASVAELLSKATLARDRLLEFELQREQIRKKRKPSAEEGECKTVQADWAMFAKPQAGGPQEKTLEYKETPGKICDTWEEAVNLYRQGQVVVAFYLPCELPADKDEIHESTLHHMTPEVQERARQAWKKLKSAIKDQVPMTKKMLNEIPFSSTGMDDSTGGTAHSVDIALGPVYYALWGPGAMKHMDRRHYRVQGNKGPQITDSGDSAPGTKRQKFAASRDTDAKRFTKPKLWGFHREGLPARGEELPSTAVICMRSGSRFVTIITNKDGTLFPDKTLKWEPVADADLDPAVHEIQSYLFTSRRPYCILLNQNQPHCADPRGIARGWYVGMQSREEFERIRSTWDQMCERRTFLRIHVPMLRATNSDGRHYTWEEVRVACTLMRTKLPIYGSGKHSEQDGAPTSCRDFPAIKARYRENSVPSWRQDGTVHHTCPDYRRRVAEAGIQIHRDFWDMPERWLQDPLEMLDEYGEEYMTALSFMNQ